MATRRVRLRRLAHSDFEVLYGWRNTRSFRSNIMSYDDVVTYDEFAGQIERSRADRPYRYMVDRRRDGQPIGFTYAHGHSGDGSTCLLNVYIEEALAGRGYGVDVFALMTQLLLRKVGVQCLFIDVFAYNKMSLGRIDIQRIQIMAAASCMKAMKWADRRS